MKAYRQSLVAGTAALCLWPAQVAAQQAAEQAVATDDATVPAIVVTARKRTENLQDVPESIAVFTSEALENRGVTDLGDLSASISNFDLRETQQPGIAFISIRGVAMQRFQEPSVAVVINGVQLTSPYQILQSLYGVERVEVLKGPQGSLYGRNAIGGAINIITRDPGNEFEGRVRLGLAEGDGYLAEARVAGPIAFDTAHFEVVGAWQKSDGLIENDFLGRPADFDETVYGRGRVLLAPASGFSLDLRGSYERRESGVAYFVNIPSGDVNEIRPVATGTEGRATRELFDASLMAELEIGDLTLTSISAYASVKDDFFQDIDFEPPALIDGSQFVDVGSLSQEVRLASDGAARLRWLAGGYWADIDQDISTILHFNTCFFADPLTCPLGPVDPATAIDLPFGVNENNNRTYAVFGQASYDVVTELELTLGMRYDRDRRRQFSLTEGMTRTATFDALQPKLSVSYDWSDDVMSYATISRGFRSGGFNGTDYITRFYDAETLWNYEVGAKSYLANRMLRFDVAFFYMDYADRQEYALQPGTGAQVLFNIPESTIYGVEAEASAALSSEVSLEFGIGFLETEVKRSSAAIAAAFGTDFVGNRLPNVPRFTANAAAQYEGWISPDLRLMMRLDWGVKSGIHWSLGNLADRQDAVHLVNARAALRHGPFEFVLFATNLFDERYYSEIAVPGFGAINPIPGGFPAQPRRLGGEVLFRF